MQVPRVARRDFAPTRRGGHPRIVVDNIPGWSAPRRWQPDYLRCVVGDHEVVVRETHGPPRNIFQNLAPGGAIAFSQYLEWVVETADDLSEIERRHSGPAAITRAVCDSDFDCSYYLDVKLERLSRTLLDETPMPDWYRAAPVDVNFWCGVLGTSSGLHCDITPNCNMQVVGRKHFTLYPPSQARRVYRVPKITHCRFDPNVADYDAFPRARRARAWECTLTPGESLYIPAGWYHQVTVVSGWAINVNVFWPRPAGQALLLPGLWRFLLRRARAKARRSLASIAPRRRRSAPPDAVATGGGRRRWRTG